jgi:AGZA family xanthine/uracil permease-like MFS transporter
MMMRQAADINWAESTIALPAFITMVMMPFTYSIADGIAWGIISYTVIMIGTGRFKEIGNVMLTLTALMLMFYLGPGDQTTFEFLLE